MTITKLNLQPITTESDYSNITIENSKFTDDIWDLSPFITAKTTKSNEKKIDFNYIKSDDLKLTVKLYLYYKLGNVKPITVKIKARSIASIVKFCRNNRIDSFEEIDKIIF